MKLRCVYAGFCLALISSAIPAQEPRQYEKVLLPVAAYVPIPGAFGALGNESLDSQ
jgi:hypothetical protein